MPHAPDSRIAHKSENADEPAMTAPGDPQTWSAANSATLSDARQQAWSAPQGVAHLSSRPPTNGAATVRVDAHCHLWQLGRGDYGWLDAGGATLDPIRRDFTAADLAPFLDAAAIARVVAVQAAPTEAETAYLLDLADANPWIGAVVGWTNLAAPDAADRVERVAERRKLVGLRPMLQDIADPEWIFTAARPDALDRMETLRLAFDALVLPVHLEPIARLADLRPELPLVIDHAAKPALGAPADDPRHAIWRTGMARLGRESQAVVKLSGLLTESRPDQRATTAAAVETLRPVVDELLNWFGPARMMWGSDWPVLTLARSYADWADVTDALLSGITPGEREAILGGTAARFYRLAAAIG